MIVIYTLIEGKKQLDKTHVGTVDLPKLKGSITEVHVMLS